MLALLPRRESVIILRQSSASVRCTIWWGSCTVESRIDRAENAVELGWSHPRSPRGSQFGQENFQERSGAGRAPGKLLVSNKFHDFFECLSVFWAQKIFLYPIRNQRASIALRSWSSYAKELTCKLDCSPYARVKLSPLLDVWLVQESFLREISPQSLLFKFHSIVLCHWGEKLNNNFTNFKGRKIYPELVPDKYTCRGGVNNHTSDFTRTSLDVLWCLRICILK